MSFVYLAPDFDYFLYLADCAREARETLWRFTTPVFPSTPAFPRLSVRAPVRKEVSRAWLRLGECRDPTEAASWGAATQRNE